MYIPFQWPTEHTAAWTIGALVAYLAMIVWLNWKMDNDPR